jgi:hypothetical protein
LARLLERRPVFAWIYTLLAVMSGWVWFRAHDFPHAATFFGSLIGWHGWDAITFETHIALFPATLAALAIGAVLSVVRVDQTRLYRVSLAPAGRAAYAALDTVAITLFLGLSVLSVAAGSYSPFLYFRF